MTFKAVLNYILFGIAGIAISALSTHVAGDYGLIHNNIPVAIGLALIVISWGIIYGKGEPERAGRKGYVFIAWIRNIIGILLAWVFSEWLGAKLMTVLIWEISLFFFTYNAVVTMNHSRSEEEVDEEGLEPGERPGYRAVSPWAAIVMLAVFVLTTVLIFTQTGVQIF